MAIQNSLEQIQVFFCEAWHLGHLETLFKKNNTKSQMQN